MGLNLVDVDSATELDAAMARVAASPEQTRQLHEMLGGFCHRSRNLLNCLKMSLYLARRETDPARESLWDDVEIRYRGVELVFDRVQAICRPMSVNLVRLSMALLFEDRAAAWTERLAGIGRRMVLKPPVEPTVGNFDPIRFGLAFDEIVEWRADVGEACTDLRVAWDLREDAIHVVWDEPAHRRNGGASPLALKSSKASPARLTMPLLTRIVSLHGGTLHTGEGVRWRIELRWPVDAQKTP